MHDGGDALGAFGFQHVIVAIHALYRFSILPCFARLHVQVRDSPGVSTRYSMDSITPGADRPVRDREHAVVGYALEHALLHLGMPSVRVRGGQLAAGPPRMHV